MIKFIKQLLKKFKTSINGIQSEYSFLNQSQLSKIVELRKRGASIGENVDILDNCIIDPDHCFHICIGNNVTFAPNVHVLAHDASTKKFIGYTKVKNTTIGSNVFVGAGSLILPGVKVGDNVIIAAGSVVTKDVTDDTVIGGNPAKQISTTSSYLRKMKESMKSDNTFSDEYVFQNLNKDRISERVNSANFHKTIFIP